MEIDPYPIQIRFSDCDMMGHVNNAVYLTYFENARVHYFGKLFGPERDWKTEGMILRTNEIEYLSPVYLHDQPFVELYVETIGTKSFTVGYEMRVNNELKTIGKSVLVCYNSIERTAVPITEKSRELLQLLKRY